MGGEQQQRVFGRLSERLRSFDEQACLLRNRSSECLRAPLDHLRSNVAGFNNGGRQKELAIGRD